MPTVVVVAAASVKGWASLPDCDFRGHVTWINPEVNALTRTIQVRAKIDNSDGSLRAGITAAA
jgi:multidrug efflux pump subunit AcrA (membrane-fusion protein)